MVVAQPAFAILSGFAYRVARARGVGAPLAFDILPVFAYRVARARGVDAPLATLAVASTPAVAATLPCILLRLLLQSLLLVMLVLRVPFLLLHPNIRRGVHRFSSCLLSMLVLILRGAWH